MTIFSQLNLHIPKTFTNFAAFKLQRGTKPHICGIFCARTYRNCYIISITAPCREVETPPELRVEGLNNT